MSTKAGEDASVRSAGSALSPLRVRAITPLTADSAAVTFEPPTGGTFSFEAGQFLTLELPWEQIRVRRCYSLCVAPGDEEGLVIGVKRVPDGRVSNHLLDHLSVGDTVDALPPDGRFVLDPARSAAPLTLFAGGSGITPVLSLTKHALRRTARQVRLLFANRDADSVMFREGLEALERAYPERLTMEHHLDAESGFVDAAKVRRIAEGRQGGDFYVCGPGPFMDTVEDALAELGVSASHVHVERFASPVDADRAEASESDPLEVPPTVTVTLAGESHEVPYRAGMTVLAACKEAGLDAPSSCEDGFCGCCMAQCLSGDLEMRTRSALGDRDVARGRVLLCQARATSAKPVHVDYDGVSFAAQGDEENAFPAISRPRLAVVCAVAAALALAVRYVHAIQF